MDYFINQVKQKHNPKLTVLFSATVIDISRFDFSIRFIILNNYIENCIKINQNARS